jgi:hypothetical protein
VTDAWDLLTRQSTAGTGADAWGHLTSQEGGGTGQTLHLGPLLLADLDAPDLSADLATVLSLDLTLPLLDAATGDALTAETDPITLEADRCH